jgi:hypothetical protein
VRAINILQSPDTYHNFVDFRDKRSLYRRAFVHYLAQTVRDRVTRHGAWDDRRITAMRAP